MNNIAKNLLLLHLGFSISLINTAIDQSHIDIGKAIHKKNIVPVAIIGAGPAGFGAATYTSRSKLPTCLFTGGNEGGHLNDIERIENWPAIPRTSGAQIAKQLKEQATSFGTQIAHNTITQVDFNQYPFVLTTDRGEAINALSVVVATGFEQVKLDIKGVNEYWGNGIGHCTICDAPFACGQSVVVIGDDDFAAERVIQLAAYAKKVTLVTRKPALTVCATVRDYLDRLTNLDIKTHKEIIEILGDGTKVTGARIKDVTSGKQMKIAAQSIYLNSSYKPNSTLFEGQLAIDVDGYIQRYDCTQQTSVPGVFACGAVTNKPNKAGPSVGFGQAAGVEVINFMHKTVGLTPELQKALEKNFFKPPVMRSIESIKKVRTRSQLKHMFSHKPITLMFAYASGCPFCKLMYPDIIGLAQEYADTVQLVTLPAHESNELVEKLDFDSVPTTFIFKDGILVRTIKGKANKKAFSTILDSIVQDLDKKSLSQN